MGRVLFSLRGLLAFAGTSFKSSMDNSSLLSASATLYHKLKAVSQSGVLVLKLNTSTIEVLS